MGLSTDSPLTAFGGCGFNSCSVVLTPIRFVLGVAAVQAFICGPSAVWDSQFRKDTAFSCHALCNLPLARTRRRLLAFTSPFGLYVSLYVGSNILRPLPLASNSYPETRYVRLSIYSPHFRSDEFSIRTCSQRPKAKFMRNSSRQNGRRCHQEKPRERPDWSNGGMLVFSRH